MFFGYLFMNRRYSLSQIVSQPLSSPCARLTFPDPDQTVVLFVSAGVVLATLARPSSNSETNVEVADYALGILMLAISSLLTGMLGVLQERTYSTYGPCWREGVFYTVTTLSSSPRRLTDWPVCV